MILTSFDRRLTSYCRCGNQTFVLKHVPESMFEHSLKLKEEFSKCSRLQIPYDFNREMRVLAFEHLQDNLRSFMKKNKGILPLRVIKRILFEVGLAVKALHDRDWIHSGTKSFKRSPKALSLNRLYTDHTSPLRYHAPRRLA